MIGGYIVKQNISSGVFIAIVSTVVVIAAIVCVWVFKAPAAEVAPPDKGGQTMVGAKGTAAMKEAHGGPTPDQQKQIEEWKKTHPGGFTTH